MGINTESEIEASLQIGPTDQGMVRIYIEAGGMEIPMDFTPDEADAIAEEIKASAGIARQTGQAPGPSGENGGRKKPKRR